MGRQFLGNWAVGRRGGDGGARGGAIASLYSILAVSGSTLSGNAALGDPGGSGGDSGLARGGIANDRGSQANLSGTIINANLAIGGSGGPDGGRDGDALGGSPFNGRANVFIGAQESLTLTGSILNA